MPDQPVRSQEVLDELRQKARDSGSERRRHEQQWRNNQLLSVGAFKTVFKESDKRRKYTPVDRTSSIIVTQWSIQTETPPRPIFSPRETNDPPIWYLEDSGSQKIQVAMQMGLQLQLTPEQLGGEFPIYDEEYKQLVQLPDPQTMPDPNAPPQADEQGNPIPPPPPQPLFAEDDFVRVDDFVAAEALTQELQSEWETQHIDEFVRQNIFDTIVLGHRDVLFQYDAEKSMGKLVDLYPWNVWCDKWQRTNADGDYYLILEILSLKKAKAMYTDISDEMWEDIIDVDIINPGEDRGDKFSMGSGSGRETVQKWTMFERNNLYPLSPEEAVEQGLVEPRMEFVSVPERGEFGEQVLDEDGQVVMMSAPDQAVTETGLPVFTLVETGEDTDPEAASWPKRTGVRQLEMIGDVILLDQETEFSDIPIARNKNIPITDSPYGQGEPFRLAPLQELLNRIWTLFREHARFFAQPQKLMPVSAIERMEGEVGRIFSSAKETIGIPDDLIHAYGDIKRVIQTLDPPQIQIAFVNMLDRITEAMDNIGGTVEVLRGEAKSDWSGATVDRLTNAARGPIGAKARHASSALAYLAGVWANAIIDFTPSDVWSERNGKYKPQVLDAMRSRLKKIGFDVKVEVSGSGSRESRIMKLNQLASTVPMLAQSPTFLRMLLEQQDVPEAQAIADEMVQPAQQ